MKIEHKALCNSCDNEMTLGISIANTNTAYPVFTTGKLYENDDRLIMVCDNKKCILRGVLQLNTIREY